VVAVVFICGLSDGLINEYLFIYIHQLSPPPGAVNFDHETISSAPSLLPVHVLEMEHSLLPDHTFGTVFLHMSVYLIFPWTPSAANGKRI